MTKLTISLAVATLFLLSFSQTSQAQVGRFSGGGYRPTKPTISPYFNYFRTNTGGLPQYQAFVRPETNLRSFVKGQNQFNQYQTSQFNTFQQQLNQPTNIVIGGTSGTGMLNTPGLRNVGMPATSATFMNFSHYFPPAGGGAPRTITVNTTQRR